MLQNGMPSSRQPHPFLHSPRSLAPAVSRSNRGAPQTPLRPARFVRAGSEPHLAVIHLTLEKGEGEPPPPRTRERGHSRWWRPQSHKLSTGRETRKRRGQGKGGGTADRRCHPQALARRCPALRPPATPCHRRGVRVRRGGWGNRR